MEGIKIYRKTIFVDGANVDRSPMAEIIMKQELRERLKRDLLEEKASKFEIDSAALFTSMGKFKNNAIEALKVLGYEIPLNLEVRNLNKMKVLMRDKIYVIDPELKELFLSQYPEAEKRTEVLLQESIDPWGKSFDEYLASALQIRAAIRKILD